jgi:hypothetical protein
MASSTELCLNDFDSIYRKIQDSLDNADHIDTGYMADVLNNQFDTDHHGLSTYPMTFDTPFPCPPSGPSSFSSSQINTPLNGDRESVVANEDDIDSDSDVEPLSLSDGKKSTSLVAYPASKM